MQFIGATVYRINYNDLPTPTYMAFNPTNVKLRAVYGVVTAGPANTRVYGIIEQLPRGLQVDASQHYVIETVAALMTAAG